MKQIYYSTHLFRSLVMGAAFSAAAFSFTSCSDEAIEAEAPVVEVQASQENGAIIPGRYIVVFKDGENLRINPKATYAERVELVRELGEEAFSKNAISSDKVTQVYGQAILGLVADLSEAEVARLKKDIRVAYVEPDRVVTLARPGSDEVTASSIQETPWGITRVGGYGNGAGKTAWVIDTGIDLDHPDLQVDVAKSRTFITAGRDAYTADDMNGHGTHVAGTIAARNNNIGVVGVAAGATVVAVKVLDSRGSGSYSGVIAGVNYVAANAKAGDVANMSLGGPVSEALDAAVRNAAAEKGILFAIAAGNDGRHASTTSPARVDHSKVYTVSAMNSSNVFASFSNFGNPPVDYCAPGVSIKSTWKSGAYNTISGTSMAAPHVAGILLLRGGSPATSGVVDSDPDGIPDPIARR